MLLLTADLIWKSFHFFNAVADRELDLRGNKIAVIENLGATEDQFDTIDLSDNEIVKLENFPYLSRLGTLIVNNNRITRINPNIGEYLPKLHTLVLTNNRLVNLAEIDPLASLPKLQFLSLLDNNITKKPNYRLYVIHKLKSLRLPDLRRLKDSWRMRVAGLMDMKMPEEPDAITLGALLAACRNFGNMDVGEQRSPKTVFPPLRQYIANIAKLVNAYRVEWVIDVDKAISVLVLPCDLIVHNVFSYQLFLSTSSITQQLVNFIAHSLYSNIYVDENKTDVPQSQIN
ncbi:hypothetical protein Syun_028446 [Stephania yunnanensis]|uniref:Uncharacterized protein n=1 Tax=Stephania yunnanensis TaxID=152371 RepID=A0AAP0EHD3_9MAGN